MQLVKQQSGFTLIEVTMAMAVFTFMLMIVTVGFLAVMSMHEAGIASRDTQQNLRFGMEELVRAGRSANRVLVPSSDRACFFGDSNTIEFFLRPDYRLYEVVLPDDTDCPAPTDPIFATTAHSDRAITSDSVKVTNLRFTPFEQIPSSVPAVYRTTDIDMEVSTDSPATLQAPDASGFHQCDTGQSGFQFCSVVRLHTSVTLRGEQP